MTGAGRNLLHDRAVGVDADGALIGSTEQLGLSGPAKRSGPGDGKDGRSETVAGREPTVGVPGVDRHGIP